MDLNFIVLHFPLTKCPDLLCLLRVKSLNVTLLHYLLFLLKKLFIRVWQHNTIFFSLMTVGVSERRMIPRLREPVRRIYLILSRGGAFLHTTKRSTRNISL